MPKLKKDTIIPTTLEDEAITKAALADKDALPFSDEEWEESYGQIWCTELSSVSC